MENTFVTPVFNGSASLRDAAGQMIENVAKSVRRGETIDTAYMEKLVRDVTSLYHLDQNNSFVAGRVPLGKLPQTAVILLVVLGITWLGIITYLLREAKKRKKKL